MTMIYNIEPYKVDLIFKMGDTIDMLFTAYKDGVLYPISGKRVDIHFKRQDGLLIKSLTSAITPQTVILGTYSFRMYADGFLESGYFNYDVQVTDGTDVLTIQTGHAWVNKDYVL